MLLEEAEEVRSPAVREVVRRPRAAARRWSARLPWLVWGASALLTGIGVLLYIRNRGGQPQPSEPVTPVMALLFPAVGAVVASRDRTNAVGWLFSSAALLGLAFFAEQYAGYTLGTAPGALPGGRWMAWIASWVWAPAFLGLRTLLFLLFPDGRPLSPRWKPFVAIVGGLLAATAVVAAVTPGRMLNLATDNPVGVNAVPVRLAPVLTYICVFLLGPLCLGGLVVRFRRSSGRERAQLRWFIAAATVTVLLPFVGFLVRPGLLSVSVYHLLAVTTALTLPAVVVLAIVRWHLYDLGVSRINALATRSLVASGLIGAALALYWSITLLAGAPPLAALAVIAITVEPLYRGLRRAVESLLAASRSHAALVGLARQLGSTVAAETVLPSIAQTVADAFEADYVGVAVNDDDGVTIAREIRGAPGEDTVVVPLLYQSKRVGELAIAPRNLDDGLDPADGRLLEDLAGQLAVAVFAVRQTGALQRAKQDAVARLEHERLCWRDVIHDTLKPTLIGIGEMVDAATEELRGSEWTATPAPDRPEPAAHVKDTLHYVRSCIQDLLEAVQRLDPELKPRTVGELGLVRAIEQRIATFGLRPGVPIVSFQPPPEPATKLATTLEVRTYMIICQAMENVDRHANARTCSVALRIDDDFVHVEVTDDGHAPSDGYQAGEGIRLMARLAAYHPQDEFLIEPTVDGGTRVLARLRRH